MRKLTKDMTQIASLLAVATVFIGLWTRIIYILHLGREGLIYTRDKTTKQTAQGGLMHTQCLADHFCWGFILAYSNQFEFTKALTTNMLC